MRRKWRQITDMMILSTPCSLSCHECHLVVLVAEATISILRTIRTVSFTINKNITEQNVLEACVIFGLFILRQNTESHSIIYSSNMGHAYLNVFWICKCSIIIAFITCKVRVLCANCLIRSLLHEQTMSRMQAFYRVGNIAVMR